MGTEKSIFRGYPVDSFIAYIAGLPYWFIDASQFSQSFKAVIHALITDNR